MNDDTEKAMQELSDISDKFNQWIEEDQARYNEKWNALSKEDQLDYFCAIAQRIFDGEIKQKGTYRYVLYNVFGFGPEAYVPAQCAGYLEIHNCITTPDQEKRLLEEFAKSLDVPEDSIEEKINNFLYKKYA